MNLAYLINPLAAAIVLGGTLLASLLQCGRRDCVAALVAVARLGRARFDAAAVRARLAPHVTAIRREGILRVDVPPLGDPGIDAAITALAERRSAGALVIAHEADRACREEAIERAVRTLAHGAELAPVFGLAGTLLALSQLAPAGIAATALPQAIGMAVLTTLYGLVLANLVLAPLARAVDRMGIAEESARQQVVDWLTDQLAPAFSAVQDVIARPSVQSLRSRVGRAAA